MIIGSHVHFGKRQILDSVEEAIGYGANAFMLYTGAPQNTMRTSISKEYLEDAKKLMKDFNISFDNVICHAPYIINLANPLKRDFGISFLKQELNRCIELGIKYIVLHPGSHVGVTKEEGINNIIYSLNEIIKDDLNCMILLETMAGKGTECGSNLEEIKKIIEGVKSNNIGVCIDTCHLNDSGYDINKFDEFLDEFDYLIGIDKIKCVHVNDSKNEKESHKDRHENIGYGTIGFDNIMKVINNSRLKEVPKILETPYYLEYPPYKFEIEMIKNNKFNDKLYEDIENYYK